MLANPVISTALDDDLTAVCYCYRTVHSVPKFYTYSGVLIGVNVIVAALIMLLAEKLFDKKYRKEFSAENADRQDLDITVE